MVKAHEVQAEVKELKKEFVSKLETINKTLTEIKHQLADLQADKRTITELETKVNEVKNENMSLKEEVEKLSRRLIAQESYNRRENLIFQGVPVTDNENCWDKIKGILMTNMKMSSDTVNAFKIQRCHRVFENQKKTNKIIVRFLWYPDREKVWKARFELSKTRIFINEDFPQEIQSRRQLLIPILKKAKQLKKRCTLSADKLIIESRTYTVDNLNDLPPELNPAEIATKRSPEVTAFFTEMSPLSNFFRCEIVVGNEKYHSVEQYLQLQKAIFAEDQTQISAIKKAKTPLQCKTIARKLTVDEKNWLPLAAEATRRACKVRFTNNQVVVSFCCQQATQDWVKPALTRHGV